MFVKRQFAIMLGWWLAMTAGVGARPAFAAMPSVIPASTPAIIALATCDAADLIAAINTANSDPAPDIIELKAGCTGSYAYTLTTARQFTDTGLPVITTAITINGAGSTIKRSSIAPRFRIFQVDRTGTLTLDAVTVSGGYTPDAGYNGGGYHGGGILNYGVLNLNHSTISGNSTGNGRYGGGCMCNADGGAGGGIANLGTLNVSESLITDNTTGSAGSDGYAAGDGGGIYNFGTLTVINSTVSGNRTGIGGTLYGGPGGNGAGINITGGVVNVTQSTISGNTTGNGTRGANGGLGAGFYVESFPQHQSIVSISNSTISNNATGSGGAWTNGGGIFAALIANSGAVNVGNSTISGNLAVSSGGGIAQTVGTLTLVNTIIAGNTAVTGANCAAAIVDGGGNLDDGTSCGLSAATSRSHANAGLDPLGLQDNGGSTRTIALVAGSDAIDAAVDTNCPNTDQRGVARPVGPHCDIGAYELENQPPRVLTSGPYSANEGSSVTVTATGSDPEGGPLTYAWDLDNNGTFETAGQSVTFSAADLDGPSSHTIAVQVTDNGGLTATAQATVNVVNVAPTVNFTVAPATLLQGQSVTLTFSSPFDPGVADTAAGFKYFFDCTNNGSFELADSLSTSYACAYPAAGTFTALGRIEDKDGGSTDYTVSVKVQTPQEGIAGLIGQVQVLIPGTLNDGQGNALIAKLRAAIQQLDLGQVAPAIHQLEAFRHDVTADISTGKLTLAQGQPLLDAANAIIAALGG